MEFNNISKPKHYCDSYYEPIEVIADWFGSKGAAVFCMGNVIKYYKRAGKKDHGKLVEDMEKAAWYAQKASEFMTYARFEDEENEK